MYRNLFSIAGVFLLAACTSNQAPTPNVLKDPLKTYIDPKEFSNGEKCDQCDFLKRTSLINGHVQETPIQGYSANGEEREFDGKTLVRTSNYINGHKIGMEYYFENGEKVDSVHMAWVRASTYTMKDIALMLPPSEREIPGTIFQESDLKFIYLGIGDNKITDIFVQNYDKEKSFLRQIFHVTYDYKDKRKYSTHVEEPYPTESSYENGNLVKSVSTNYNGKLFHEFDVQKYFKEYYENGSIKISFKGESETNGNKINFMNGVAHVFFDNGKTAKEATIKNGNYTSEKDWNESGTLVKDADIETHYKEFLDNGSVKVMFFGQFEATDTEPKFINGIYQEFDEHEKLIRESLWQNGKAIRTRESKKRNVAAK